MTILPVIALLLAAVPVPSIEAGKATRVVPRVELTHGRTHTQLNEKDAVSENDRIHTEANGRPRVVLSDGSILNVGSDSQMTIKAAAGAGPAAGPATVELAFGKLRAEINKRVSGGTAFEVRTSTAVCGVLGTTLFVEQTKEFSHVINLSPADSGSQVKVTSSNRRLKKYVTLNPGQGTLVYKGKAPSDPHVMGQVDRDKFSADTDIP
jgi:ferric-dicitrate binding protein FerR (iron transport regulator)